jgi:hypothetical protein
LITDSLTRPLNSIGWSKPKLFGIAIDVGDMKEQGSNHSFLERTGIVAFGSPPAGFVDNLQTTELLVRRLDGLNDRR